jgi:hypothetical protein
LRWKEKSRAEATTQAPALAGGSAFTAFSNIKERGRKTSLFIFVQLAVLPQDSGNIIVTF